MANTFFDPLRSDPFSNSTTTNKTNQIVPYGIHSSPSSKEQHEESISDVLLQFTNSPGEVITSNSYSKNENHLGDGVGAYNAENDVRKSRKKRTIFQHDSPTSLVSSSSLNSRISNIHIAPPPEIPMGGGFGRGKDYTSSLFHMTYEPNPAHQPKYELISHSGTCMARISVRTKLLKLWKNVFWIVYDDTEFLVFKNKNVFEEWLMNPYLTKSERLKLVKLRVDFMTEPSTFGYQVSILKPKYYRQRGMINQFKLDIWDFAKGPSILAAFGSSEPQDVTELRVVLKELLQRSPVSIDKMGFHNAAHDMYSGHSVASSSAGDSIYSAPTFARPQGYMSSAQSI